MASSSSPSGLSLWVFLVPELFLWLTLAGGLLADIVAWSSLSRRLVLAALLIVVWAGAQGLVITLALASAAKDRPLSPAALLTALARTVLSLLLFLPGAVYAARRPGLTGRLVFAAVGCAMLVQLPSLALLHRKIRRKSDGPDA